MSQINFAIEALKDGKLVAIPTETVYGLAAPIDNTALLEKIFHIKERPYFDPLIVHVATVEMAKKLVLEWPEVATALVEKFWPGPLTLVLKKNNKVTDLITSGLDTVGLRMPDHLLTLEFIKKLNKPVAAPSANKFKKTSPTKAEHVSESFQSSEVFVLDGGKCKVGIESTIVLLQNQEAILLRKGMITSEELNPILKKFGLSLLENLSKKIQAPGQIEHHYMPSVPLVFVANLQSDWKKKLSSFPWNQSPGELQLGEDPFMAARNLYSQLRELAKKSSFIYWSLNEQKNKDPYWEALVDRLKRATSHFLE